MKIKHLIEELQMLAHFHGDIDVVWCDTDNIYSPVIINPFVGVFTEKHEGGKNLSTFNDDFEDDKQVNAVCIN
tara:strand:- start:590 stop:808 length:219 start_codon:yes stop_codon:yes gene_type:complete